MKEFFQMMRRFVSPYKRYVAGAVVLNILSAIFNVFSFSLLIPILNILHHPPLAGAIPCRNDFVENRLLLRFVCGHDSAPHRSGARHPYHGLLKSDALASQLPFR